jgi:hypothetical protein
MKDDLGQKYSIINNRLSFENLNSNQLESYKIISRSLLAFGERGAIIDEILFEFTDWFHIAQLEIYDISNNKVRYTKYDIVAPTAYYNDDSNYGIDNIYDNSLTTFYHSDDYDGNFKLKLNPSRFISHIIISNRHNCCQERMASYILSIKKDNNIIHSIRMKANDMTQKYSIINNKLVYEKLNIASSST